ncbi:alkaline phosphatase family protein [Candidatus Methylopumilus universalis]|uniref:alkaline phosphatase family protein n=1 Tax=Candidatus Methylopumilus universalis TaxID=2588536 RepID=UPI00111FAEBC|nr:alkaline phosphatase family protein [Candidatus Methylopumilus universalis]QDC99118.1 alkaline phosphatase family protein [Candidatus Methylopumilus universalis]
MNLLIFIDGLSFKNSRKLSLINTFKVKKVIPGVGFSNNIYAEIVTGKTPDEIGYFNEWSLCRFPTSRKVSFYKFLDYFRGIKYLNLAIRLFLKKCGFNFFNIPFSYFNMFQSNGPHHFSFFKSPNIIKDFNFLISDSSQIKKSVGKRDLIAINSLYKSYSKNTFLSLVDLDNISHIYGVNSKQYDSHLKLLDFHLLRLINFFKTNKPLESLNIFIFSDHGMSNVTKVLALNVEHIFGKPSDFTYHYFIDSTFIRFWTYDKVFHLDILKYLKGYKYGKIINRQERKTFGITNKDFGDIIFRLNEGMMFVPNFFGVRACKSMHGYSSYSENQAAFIATNANVNLKYIKYSRDLYKFFKNYLIL